MQQIPKIHHRSSLLANFEIRNAQFAERVNDSFNRQGFMTHLGARIDKIKAGQVEIHVPFEKHLSQQHGFFHGGLIGTIGDNAGGYSAFSLMAATDSVLTVEYKLNIMAPAMGELLIARGRVVRPGRMLSVCQSDIFVSTKGVEKLCATMLGTFMTMADAPDEPSVKNSKY
jgi:uncharacterized protein (TIGR00369 family)